MSPAFAFGVGQSMCLVQCRRTWAQPIICMVVSHPNDSGFASASSLSEPDLATAYLPELRAHDTQPIQTGFLKNFFMEEQQTDNVKDRLKIKDKAVEAMAQW